MSDPVSANEKETAAAERLARAQASGLACPPVRDLLGRTDLESAYRVQHLHTKARLASGATVSGRKIGLTAPVVQRQLGVDQPDLGVLFDDMDVSVTGRVPAGRLLQPKVEGEVAFVLARDLDGSTEPEDVRAAVDHAVAAIEVVDSRVADWDIAITDTIADNGSSGLYVLGKTPLSLAEFDPVDTQLSLAVDGEVVSTGNGAACLGDPLLALQWLARTAQAFGDPLRAGQVVLSGALGPMVPVRPGAEVRAEIAPLGSVSVVFDSDNSEGK